MPHADEDLTSRPDYVSVPANIASPVSMLCIMLLQKISFFDQAAFQLVRLYCDDYYLQHLFQYTFSRSSSGTSMQRGRGGSVTDTIWSGSAWSIPTTQCISPFHYSQVPITVPPRPVLAM